MRVAKGFSANAALVLCLTMPLFFGAGQEIFATFSPHDDYYFVRKAGSWGLNGNYLAPIKEVLFPLYIRLSWVFGLSLRNFEALCYGTALFSLWAEASVLARSKVVAFGTVLPLALFVHQHVVFNHATYDALQLILMPLTFSSAILVFRKSGNLSSLTLCGLVISAHTLTRPEGFLFVLPPAISLLFVLFRDRKDKLHPWVLKWYLPKLAILLAVSVLSQQVASAINWHHFHFWAPTIIKAPSFQEALAALMKLETADDGRQRYAPVSKSALESAYRMSPAFRRAKPFFDQHIDGRGWSANALPGYRPSDGSIGGGHFQWALLDAGTFVAGPRADAILDYLGRVAQELKHAVEREGAGSRLLISTALGPNFSLIDGRFWVSLWKVGRMMVLPAEPILPMIPGTLSKATVERNFDRLTLRRRALLDASQWQMVGWVADNKTKLPPVSMELDAKALKQCVDLRVVERADVAKAHLGSAPEAERLVKYGVELSSPGPWAGNLLLSGPSGTDKIPLQNLQEISSDHGYDGGIHYLHTDWVSRNQQSPPLEIIPLTTWLTKLLFAIVNILIPISFLLILVVSLVPRWIGRMSMSYFPVTLIFGIAASVVLPRLVLLAGIDAFMYPGGEARYVTTGVFSVWVFATFTSAYGLVTFFQFYKART